MSSAWEVGQVIVLGLAAEGQAARNLRSRPDLVINVRVAGCPVQVEARAADVRPGVTGKFLIIQAHVLKVRTDQRIAGTRVAARPPTWHEDFRQLLDEALDHGRPELNAVARRLMISRRTLQRRLADHGTSWRAELDSARQRRARQPSPPSRAGLHGLTRRLGYTDPRSARRALKRWDDQASG